MRKLTFAMNLSVDGYIAAPGDELGWSVPSDELFQWWSDRVGATGLALYGRKLWETMSSHWPTADQQPGATPAEIEFARRWRDMPKVVFSSTTSTVDWNTRLVTGDAVTEITRLKAEDGGPIDIGGATLAAAAMRAGLIDEYVLVTAPVLVGGGTPFFTALENWVDLTLVETRTFPDGVVLTRYETRRSVYGRSLQRTTNDGLVGALTARPSLVVSRSVSAYLPGLIFTRWESLRVRPAWSVDAGDGRAFSRRPAALEPGGEHPGQVHLHPGAQAGAGERGRERRIFGVAAAASPAAGPRACARPGSRSTASSAAACRRVRWRVALRRRLPREEIRRAEAHGADRPSCGLRAAVFEGRVQRDHATAPVGGELVDRERAHRRDARRDAEVSDRAVRVRADPSGRESVVAKEIVELRQSVRSR